MSKFTFANEIPGWDKMSEKERIKATYENRDEILYLRADATLMKRAEDEYAEVMEEEAEEARTNPQIQRDLVMQRMEEAAKSGEIDRFKELSTQYKRLGSQTIVIETTVDEVQKGIHEQGERAGQAADAQREKLRIEGLRRRGIEVMQENQGNGQFGSPAAPENTGLPADMYHPDGSIDMKRYSQWYQDRKAGKVSSGLNGSTDSV